MPQTTPKPANDCPPGARESPARPALLSALVEGTTSRSARQLLLLLAFTILLNDTVAALLTHWAFPIPATVRPLVEGGVVLTLAFPTVYFLAICPLLREVRQRQQVEDSLRESEAECRLIFDQSPIGSAIVSLDFRYLRVNRQFCLLTGYTEAELTALRFTDITHPEDRELDAARARQLAAGEIEQHTMEKRYLRKNGATVWVELTARPLRGAAGQPLHYLALTQDITARKQAERGLAQLAAIIESSDDAIVSESLDGLIVSWNSGAEALYGYAEPEAVGRSFSMLFPINCSDQIASILDQVRRGQRLHHLETTQRTKQGKLIDVSLSVSPVKNSADEITGVSTIARDITRRKQAERERDRLLEELQVALTQVKHLSGLLPICAHCKKIRDDKGCWTQVELYIRDRSRANFTHSICPDCATKYYPEIYQKAR